MKPQKQNTRAVVEANTYKNYWQIIALFWVLQDNF
jgi:hypothetical protein